MLDRDLDLAVELVNTVYVLAEPQDRLTDIEVFQRILRDAGLSGLAGQLTSADLPDLRALRDAIAPVFAASDRAAAAAALNPLLAAARAVPQLSLAEGALTWSLEPAGGGSAAVRGLLLGALAAQLVAHGTDRTGVCQASPCTCVFVDRSRARTRRFCCDQCNDRSAAAAYRRRRRG